MSKNGVNTFKLLVSTNTVNPRQDTETPEPAESIGHSTPVRVKGRMIGSDNSPEIDYYCSPIPVPCTQDGNNEVAWDWQGSKLGRQKKDRREQKVLDTPKKSNLENKKRNSPLLRKPLKRKLVAKESNENIGKFAAELKALNEDLKQKSCLTHVVESSAELTNCVENQLHIDNDKNHNDKVTKSPVLFEDLFEDGIEESLVRCSQEVEEKFHLRRPINDDKWMKPINESLSSNENDTKPSMVSSNSITSERSLDKSKNLYPTTQSLSSDLCSKTQIGMLTNVRNRQLNIEKTCSNNGQCEFPDDSFDDLILTCVDEEKLMSKSNEYDCVGPHSPIQPFRRKNNNRIDSSNNSNEQVIPAPPKTIVSSNSFNNTNNSNKISNRSKNFTKSTDDSNVIEGRKFFKTKSLSESYFNQTSPKKRRSNKTPNNTKSNNISKGGQSNNSGSKNALSRYHSAHDLKTNYGASGSQSGQCTSEQIEMKRIQAKMRLEAKRKLFSNNIAVPNLPKHSSNHNIH